ncbi:MAG: Na/Pi cotransporter family protein [Lachnospiraceae bacterium]|nr:Na/Pi cotransporter family protein [Lachnospiraceae bacterium]MCI9398342.1 Na/Pi cotransporter family protein [Lachnospiraceae bacterium]
MSFFDLLSMVGGLALFLYGMHILSEGLEKLSGGRLERILENLTNSKWKAVLLGAGVTAVIQSSSATTVMVVGFVNSGIMKLKQAIGVIMGANVGTTVTSWILSLTGIESDNFLVKLLKPTSFSPLLAIVGVIFIMFLKNGKKRDLGTIFVGFAILMFGMDAMSSAMKPLSDIPEFTRLFTMFTNPILGLLVGALLTAIIQSSSASIGILQALCGTGTVTYAAAVPIIMGQNIGTCVTAMMSGVGATKNAKRAAMVHLLFNVIGTAIFMVVFYLLHAVIQFDFMDESVNKVGIACVHTGFNIVATLVLLPFSNILERLSLMIIKPDEEELARAEKGPEFIRLDERFLSTPSFALEQANSLVIKMAEITYDSLKEAIPMLFHFDKHIAENVEYKENLVDRYDDEISSYLVKLSSRNLSVRDSHKLNMLLHSIGDLERISDHAMNIVDSAREINKKEQSFSAKAVEELKIFSQAVEDILADAVKMLETEDEIAAKAIEPFEEVIDVIQKEMKKRHTKRLRKGKCTAEMGFVLSDITNNYERIADHCSNLAINVMQLYEDDTHAHEYIDTLQKDEGSFFAVKFQEYLKRYELPNK